MAKPFLLKPTFDRKHNKWRLNLPAVISPSGKRERHLFEKHHEALAEANRLRQTLHDFGKSLGELPQAIPMAEGYLDFWLETKVSEITPGNIKFSLQKLPSGNFNSNVRLLRAVMNHGVKHSWPKNNPAPLFHLRTNRSHWDLFRMGPL